jgi:phosphatidylserine decarboxylase
METNGSDIMPNMQHQYVERDTGRLCTEILCSDGLIQFLYSEPVREKAAWLFRLLTSHRLSSQLLALLSFDLPFGAKRFGVVRFLQSRGINFHECVDPDITKKTARAIFERQIRYWECRPMPQTRGTVVAPADARLVLGSLQQQSHFFIKEKFFAYEELLGAHQQRWLRAFAGGDVVICRLTPEKYHYTHCPVSGIVRDIYDLPGAHHSCHPTATVALATPFSKNRRVVTIIDTDVAYGSGVGLVAMIEVVALMVGNIVQCYSEVKYKQPQQILPGMFLKVGQPKSLFRPGSSTVVMLLQAGRVQFAQDLLCNQTGPGISVFSQGFRAPLMETEVRVRSYIATQSRLTS